VSNRDAPQAVHPSPLLAVIEQIDYFMAAGVNELF
jgi:hypothetical protein